MRSTEDLWLGLEYVPALTQRKLETTYFGGEAIPADDIHPLMAGWILGCGSNVGFAEDTIWHTPFMSSLDESEIGKWRTGPGDPWLGKVEALIDRLLDNAQGQYLVGYAYQLPLNDLLSLLRGPAGAADRPGGGYRAVPPRHRGAVPAVGRELRSHPPADRAAPGRLRLELAGLVA